MSSIRSTSSLKASYTSLRPHALVGMADLRFEPDLRFEAHVKHPVRFVENKVRHTPAVGRLCVCVCVCCVCVCVCVGLNKSGKSMLVCVCARARACVSAYLRSFAHMLYLRTYAQMLVNRQRRVYLALKHVDEAAGSCNYYLSALEEVEPLLVLGRASVAACNVDL